MNQMIWSFPTVQNKIKKARRLLFMAYECGVSHGDYHLGNILDVTPLMLIDFGRSRLVKEDEKMAFSHFLGLSEESHDYSMPIHMLIDDILPSLQDHLLYQWLRCSEYPNVQVPDMYPIEAEVAPREAFPPIEFQSEKDRAECIAGECTVIGSMAEPKGGKKTKRFKHFRI